MESLKKIAVWNRDPLLPGEALLHKFSSVITIKFNGPYVCVLGELFLGLLRCARRLALIVEGCKIELEVRSNLPR